MRALYGITNHNPLVIDEMVSDIALTIKQKNSKSGAVRPTSYQFMNVGDVYNGKSKVVVCVTLATFLKNLSAFQDSKAVIYLVDSPLLCDTLQPITFLDCEKHTNFKYTYRRLDPNTVRDSLLTGLSSEHFKISQNTLDLIPTLLDATVPSILTPIQQFLYAVPDAERRAEYKSVIYQWLLKGEKVSALADEIKRVSGGRLTERHKRILEFFNGEGHKLVTIMNDIRLGKEKKKAVNYKKLCKQHGIAKFDLKYLMQSIKKSGMSFEPYDALEVAKERKVRNKQLKAQENAIAL